MSKNILDTIFDAVLTFFGLGDVRNLDSFSYDPEFLPLKQNLIKARDALYRIVIEYPESPIYQEKNLDKFNKDQANQLLNDLMNQQSKISRWASNYSPIGSAYKLFHKQTDLIADKVASAQQKYENAVSAQEQYEKQVDEDNAKKAADYQKRLSQAEKAASVRNQLDQSLTNAQNQIEALEQISPLLKGEDSYNRLKQTAVDSATQALNQVKSYETQKLSQK